MIQCGVTCLNCDFPIHLDTYIGCSHKCKYCRVKRVKNIDIITVSKSDVKLKNFISGKRNTMTRWCDWDIPLQWGANSDPFQECEKEYQESLRCLEIFAESKYPFIVTTKNPVLLTEEPYFSLIKECNAVIQCSMACDKYDRLETGAPAFRQRLEAMKTLAPYVKRTISRLCPYFPDALRDILAALPMHKDAGIQGVIVSGFCSNRKHPQMEKYGGRWMFPNDLLFPQYKKIKERCHELGLEFTCVESGLSWLSDSTTCCGVSGLDGFIPNTYNLDHIALGDAKSTPAMEKPCDHPFRGIKQNQAWNLHVQGRSFKDLMDEQVGNYPAWYAAERARFE